MLQNIATTFLKWLHFLKSTSTLLKTFATGLMHGSKDPNCLRDASLFWCNWFICFGFGGELPDTHCPPPLHRSSWQFVWHRGQEGLTTAIRRWQKPVDVIEGCDTGVWWQGDRVSDDMAWAGAKIYMESGWQVVWQALPSASGPPSW